MALLGRLSQEAAKAAAHKDHAGSGLDMPDKSLAARAKDAAKDIFTPNPSPEAIVGTRTVREAD